MLLSEKISNLIIIKAAYEKIHKPNRFRKSFTGILPKIHYQMTEEYAQETGKRTASKYDAIRTNQVQTL